MTDEIVEPGEEEDTYRLTKKGAITALAAYKMFKSGLNHEEIAEALELGQKEDVQIIIAMADHIGMLDAYDEMLRENGIDPMEDSWPT